MEHIKGRGCVILEKGLVVCALDQWLAASPDGAIDDILLEIKYPISFRDCPSLCSHYSKPRYQSEGWPTHYEPQRPQRLLQAGTVWDALSWAANVLP